MCHEKIKITRWTERQKIEMKTKKKTKNKQKPKKSCEFQEMKLDFMFREIWKWEIASSWSL